MNKSTIVKTLKENNTKVTKDVLLHQIFQEISDEIQEINNDIYLNEIIPAPKRKLFKIKEIQKKWQWFFIVILVISIMYVLFTTHTESIQSEDQKMAKDIYTIPQANHIAKQEKETELLSVSKEEAKTKDIVTKTNPIELIEKSGIEKNNVPKKEIDTKTQTVFKPKKLQTEREKAKEALLRQMQN